MGEPKVYIVGSLNADHRVQVTRIPAPGETVLGGDIVVAPGGKGANQAVAVSRAGGDATIVGALGRDRDGDLLARTLEAENIDTTHLHVVADAPTGRAMISVDGNGENAIVVSPGANSALTTDHVDAGLSAIGVGDLLLLQLETPLQLVTHAARLASRAGATVILNAAPVPQTIGALLDDVDVLVVNEHELNGVAALLGISGKDMTDLAEAIGATVVCTAGSDGAFVTHSGRVEHVAAQSVDAVDTTAAGDTFIGYLAARLAAAPDDVLAAATEAVHAAGVAVTRPGAIDSIPHRAEITKGLP